MRNILFWSLFPLALPQAIWVRKIAPRFAAAEGPVSGTMGKGRCLKLLAVGDSIIVGVGARRIENALVYQTSRALAETLSCRVEWSAFGRIGAKSKTLLHEFLPKLPPEPADAVIVSVGVNDITSLTAQAAWRGNLEKVLRALFEHSPDAVVAVAGIPPMAGFPLLPQPLRFASGQRGRAFDFAARRVIAGFPSAFHVPIEMETTPEKFSADGFHPSEASYRTFGAVVAERIVNERRRRNLDG